MKETVQESYFIDRFAQMDRKENFSYEGKKALFEYLEQYEEDSLMQQQQERQEALQQQQQAVEAQITEKKEERQQRLQEKILEAETKIAVAEIGNDKEDEGGESAESVRISLDKLKQDQKKIDEEYKLKNKELKETIRHNKVTEVIDRKKAVQKPTIKK